MGANAAIAKNNRRNNSGGVMPDPLHVMNTLSIALKHFDSMFKTTRDKEKYLITFIYLWLTQQLENIKSADDIPSLSRVTGDEQCDAHRLRIIKMDGNPWVEYAQHYTTPHDEHWQWQPIPKVLRHFFYYYTQSLSTTAIKPLLSHQEKQKLWHFLNKSWTTPEQYLQYGRLRKDLFFRYFTTVSQRSPLISAITKSVLLPEHYRHHASAKAYQKENSDQIRYQIFNMHNHYLDRLDNTSQQYAINLSINSSCHKISSLFDPKVTLPSYLNEGEGFGKIYAFKRQRNYQDQGYKFIQLPSVEIGSRRCLPKDTVIDFFKDIDDYVNKYATRLKWTKVQLIDYYNACTYQLAFQFLILTGVRPTHALSLETQRCYGLKQAIHADKGRYRVIFLCNFLQQSIRDYLSLQKDILTQLKVETTSPYLWFLLDNKSQPLHLNAKMMRQFMQQHWPNKDKDNIDPYCLRHTFAQLALTAINKKENEHEHERENEHEHEREKELLLTPQQIDRLMGHSSFGEHLGSDYCFPPNRKILLAFLNSLPTELKFTLHSKRLENTNQSEEDDHEKPL